MVPNPKALPVRPPSSPTATQATVFLPIDIPGTTADNSPMSDSPPGNKHNLLHRRYTLKTLNELNQAAAAAAAAAAAGSNTSNRNQIIRNESTTSPEAMNEATNSGSVSGDFQKISKMPLHDDFRLPPPRKISAPSATTLDPSTYTTTKTDGQSFEFEVRPHDSDSEYEYTSGEDDCFFEEGETEGAEGKEKRRFSLFHNLKLPPSLPLLPFSNQVGGHASFFRFSKKAICKPVSRREQEFYEFVEALHPELLPFIPQYLGVLNVAYRSDGDQAVPEVIFEKNKHILPEWLLKRLLGPDASPEPYLSCSEKDCHAIGRIRGSSRVNSKLREQVLREVLSPRSLRARLRRVHSQFSSRRPPHSEHRRHSVNDIRAEILKSAKSVPVSLLSASRSFANLELDSSSDVVGQTSPSSIITVSEDEGDDDRRWPADDGHQHHEGNGEASVSNGTAAFAAKDKQGRKAQLSRVVEYSPETSIFRMDDYSSPRPPSPPDSPPLAHSLPTRLTPPISERLTADQPLLLTPKPPQKDAADHPLASISHPWSRHIYHSTLSKLKESAEKSNDNLHQFILIEDLTDGLKHPCILDLKMGTRQHGVDATREKMLSQTQKCEKTTSKALGVRVCGMQVYKETTKRFLFQDKYFGRSLTPETFNGALKEFLNNGFCVLIHHIPVILRKLRRLARIIRKLHGYRFYASSLLVFYDGNVHSTRKIDIKIIDFAHCMTNRDLENVKNLSYPPSHDGPDHGYLLGLKNLCKHFEAIWFEEMDRLHENVHRTGTGEPAKYDGMEELSLEEDDEIFYGIDDPLPRSIPQPTPANQVTTTLNANSENSKQHNS
ncbi:uncharacterized protein VTP21DRAFT_2020 [Calcarisporiella thermophila]|uniref:uncharacterized protein n=1 Tax=Calcarisporiella thermophila TaxID=911321 RepID=UPI003744843E